MRLLVVEKSHKLNQLITESLIEEGFKIDSFSAFSDALVAVSTIKTYRMMIVDLELESEESFQQIKQLRELTPKTTILVTTAHSGLDRRIKILDAGADDVLMKPYSMAEMAAHCRAMMRRAENGVQEITIEAGNVTLNPNTFEVYVDDKRVHFTKREINLLTLLMRRFNRVVPKTNLLDSLFAFDDNAAPNAIEAIVSRLRRRLKAASATVVIHTEHSIGYCLMADSSTTKTKKPGKSARKS